MSENTNDMAVEPFSVIVRVIMPPGPFEFQMTKTAARLVQDAFATGTRVILNDTDVKLVGGAKMIGINGEQCQLLEITPMEQQSNVELVKPKLIVPAHMAKKDGQK